MSEEHLLRHLRDQDVLLLAYAASSAYVLRQAYTAIPELQSFRGKPALAPVILGQLRQVRKSSASQDPVVIGAHLYALELAGARAELAGAVTLVLREPVLRDNPLLGPLAGQVGAPLLKTAPPAVDLTRPVDRKVLDGIARSLALETDGKGGDGK